MHFYMEMTYMQISAELHLNKSTMAKRLRTALKRIKAEMIQEGIRDCPF
jgi:DNA-directed RNA polymerase specialized sigma24 family protein